jgi:hypothetical protein
MIKSPVNELLKSLLSIYASHAGALLVAFVVVYRDFPSNNSKSLHVTILAKFSNKSETIKMRSLTF